MFSTSEFQTWAKANVVPFAAVMTKSEERPHDELLRTYGFGGFPSLALLDANGDAIMKGIGRDVHSMSSAVKAARDYEDLKAKFDAGDEVDQGRWLLARLGLNKLELEEAMNEFMSLNLEGEQRQAAIHHLVQLELGQLMGAMREGGDAAVKSAQQRVLVMFHEGWTPPEGAGEQRFYDSLLIAAAKEQQDEVAFRYAYPRVRAQLLEQKETFEGYLDRYKDDEATLGRVRTMIERNEKELAELEAAAKQLGSG